MNSIVITSFIAFAIISGILTVFENVFGQGEEAEQRQDQSPSTLDDNNGSDYMKIFIGCQSLLYTG